jgi:DNA-binding cell septation regulator SpoVG
MAEFFHIEVGSFSSAPAERQREGLPGWFSITLNGALAVDGIALRRTRAGELALSFPERRDRAGNRHSVVRPISNEARRAIERQVLDALRTSVRRPPKEEDECEGKSPDDLETARDSANRKSSRQVRADR